MIAIRLPNYSDHLGKPVFALVETPAWHESDDEMTLPLDAVILQIPRPSSLLMAHVPDVTPGDAANKGLWEAWLDDVLVRVIAAPRLTAGDIELRGPDRDLLVSSLLRIWGWFSEHSDQQCPAPDASKNGPRCGHYPYMPNKTVLSIIAFLSVRLKTPPHELMAWKFDDLMLAHRALRVSSGDSNDMEDLG